MRILYSHRTQSGDGQYVHIRALTDALIERGHDLRIVGPDGVSAKAARPLDAGKAGPSFRSGLPGPVYEAAEFAYSLVGYRQLRKAARGFLPDVLYERYNLFYHAGAWLSQSLKRPLILEVNAPLVDERTAHGALAMKALARRSEAAIWRAADHVVPVTGALAEIVARAGVPEGKISVIPNGVDEEFLSPRDGATIRKRYELDDSLVLGFTGFVRDWHGVDRVLRFIADRRERDLKLLLVGDGPARAGLEALAHDLGIADRLVITGVVQRDAMADHVAAMDVALQPAVTAYASPLKLFEYMAQGRAIIAPRQPNIEEVLVDGVDALLFDPACNEEFDRALARLIGDEALRHRLGAGALAQLEKRDYRWSANAARVERIANRLGNPA